MRFAYTGDEYPAGDASYSFLHYASFGLRLPGGGRKDAGFGIRLGVQPWPCTV